MIRKSTSLLILFFCIGLLTGCYRNKEYSYNRSSDFVIRQRPIDPPPIFTPYVKSGGVIVVDAGHGGDDYGTKSASTPKYHEKSLNLSTTLILNDYLQKLGYKVILTRSTDEFISLQRRAELANEKNADLFVSVHYNSAPAKQAEGIEIFYYKNEDDKIRTQESKKLASAILAKVIKITDAKSRGVKQGNFAVIRETKMPAILIEGGFLSNENEMEKIKDPAYVKSIAWGIAQGIQSYMDGKSK